MASNGNPPTWVPYQPPKDCSQGFCSIYCPQWCYIIFPPPPPFDLADDGSGPAFSPLVIAIIGILASAFLLVSYYTIISKYCGGFDSLRRRFGGGPASGDREPDDGPGQSRRHDGWQASPSDGLDEALINRIAVYKYSRRDGLVDGTDCSVCLSEFREDESLRLLPKCCHAFHIQCIDTWLKSHSNCPLCRSTIVTPWSGPLQQPSPVLPEAGGAPSPAGGEGGRDDEIVVVVEDLDCPGAEETRPGNDGAMPKDSARIRRDLGGPEASNGVAEIRDDGVQQIRRSFSMDSVHRCRVSIADVLQISMEDELMAAKDHGLLVSTGSSRQSGGVGHGKDGSRTRGLHCVMSPVPMKRSLSSGRFCFTKQGRGRNAAVLPV